MKTSELMIGDYVIFHDHGWNSDGTDWEEDLIAQVCEIRETLLTLRIDGEEVSNLDIERCSPILLSREILEKNGFKLKEESETHTTYVSVWDEISIISFTFYKETICGVDTLLECELGFAGGLDRIHHCHIKYVHQLQHALRLCGIDKEIEI